MSGQDGPGRVAESTDWAGQAELSKTKIGPGGPEEYLGQAGPRKMAQFRGLSHSAKKRLHDSNIHIRTTLVYEIAKF